MGQGHHYWPKRHDPPLLFRDSAFNVLKPPGISRGDFYELHYAVDPKMFGARLPPRFIPKGYSGKKLGLDKYGPLARTWKGAPGPLKARVGGLGATAGSAIYDMNEEGDW